MGGVRPLPKLLCLCGRIPLLQMRSEAKVTVEVRCVNLGYPLWTRLARRSMRTDRNIAQEIRFLFPHGLGHILSIKGDVRKWLEGQAEPFRPEGHEFKNFNIRLAPKQWDFAVWLGEELSKSRWASTVTGRRQVVKNGRPAWVSSALRLILARGLEVVRRDPGLDPRPAEIARWKREAIAGMDFLPAFDESFPIDEACQLAKSLGYCDPEVG